MASYNSKVHVLGLAWIAIVDTDVVMLAKYSLVRVWAVYLGLHAGKCNELAVISYISGQVWHLYNSDTSKCTIILSSNITDKHNSEIVHDSLYTTDHIELIIDNCLVPETNCMPVGKQYKIIIAAVARNVHTI